MSLQVWEIRGADLTLSPVYTAAAGLVSAERGLSLRFPRFIKVREDKSIEQASESCLPLTVRVSRLSLSSSQLHLKIWQMHINGKATVTSTPKLDQRHRQHLQKRSKTSRDSSRNEW